MPFASPTRSETTQAQRQQYGTPRFGDRVVIQRQIGFVGEHLRYVDSVGLFVERVPSQVHADEVAQLGQLNQWRNVADTVIT